MSTVVSKVKAFLETGESDVVKAAEFVVGKILPDLEKISGDAATIQGIAGLAGPAASEAAQVALALLAWAIKVIEAGAAASAAGGINVTLDQDVVTAVKSVAAAIKPAAKTA
jgi:hypothetical protein